MKRKEFIRLLKQATKRNWHIQPNGRIVTEGPMGYEFCPITALAFDKRDTIYPISRFFRAGKDLGLSPKKILKLVDAADKNKGYSEKVRQEIIEALSPHAIDGAIQPSTCRLETCTPRLETCTP